LELVGLEFFMQAKSKQRIKTIAKTTAIHFFIFFYPNLIHDHLPRHGSAIGGTASAIPRLTYP
jgi:hypothetical protein